MKLVHDTEERVRSGLKEAISLLCKTGLNFTSQLSIDGLLGITLDRDEVFLVSIKEVIKNPQDFSVTSSSSACAKPEESPRGENLPTHSSSTTSSSSSSSRRKAPTSSISRFGSASRVSDTGGATYLRASPHKRLHPAVDSSYPGGRAKRSRAHDPHDSHTSVSRAAYSCVDLSSDDSQAEYYEPVYTSQTITISPEEAASHETEVAGRRESPLAGRRDSPLAGRRESPMAGRRDSPLAGRRDSPLAGRRDVVDLSVGGRAWGSVKVTDSEPEVIHSSPLNLEMRPEATPIEVRPIEPALIKQEAGGGDSNPVSMVTESGHRETQEPRVFKQEPTPTETVTKETKQRSPRQLPPNSPSDSIASSSSGVAPVVDPEAHAVWLQSIAAFVQQPAVLHPFPDSAAVLSNPLNPLPGLIPIHSSSTLGTSETHPGTQAQYATSRLSYTTPAEAPKRGAAAAAVPQAAFSRDLALSPPGAATGTATGTGTDREQPFLISRQGMCCSNCGTCKTTTWRRSVEGNPMCNACGLYYKLHKSSSPRASKSAPNCANCGTNVTTMWRRNDKGEPVCNACGLYFKLHKVNRPLSMVKGEIHCRRRQKKPSSYRGSWLGTDFMSAAATTTATATSSSTATASNTATTSTHTTTTSSKGGSAQAHASSKETEATRDSSNT